MTANIHYLQTNMKLIILFLSKDESIFWYELQQQTKPILDEQKLFA